jgi:hypothetical protein
VDTGIAELSVKSAAQVARDANKAVADSEAESASAPEAKAPAPQPEVDAAPAAGPVAEAPKPPSADLPRRYWMGRYEENMLPEEAVAKLRELDAEAGKNRQAIKSAPTAFMRDMYVNAASQAASLAGKLRADINQYPEVRALLNAAAPAPQAPPQGRAPEAAAPADLRPTADTTAPTNRPQPAEQTRPERLIELRKRQAVLRQLLECLG